MVYLLICFVFASALQGFFYHIQMKKVNSFFQDLRKEGNVLVGVHRGFYKKGAIILLLLKEDKIEKAYLMEGRTVFSKINPLNEFNGLCLKEVNNFKSKSMEYAFKDAFTHYKNSLA